MKPTHIEHIGIAVKSLDEAIPFYEKVLGLKCYAIEEVKDQKVKTAFFQVGFQGREELIRMVTDARPDIISHNMETVRRISPLVRSVATYDRSLEVIRQIAESGITAKSGIMVGLGETPEEVEQTMDDLLANGCRILTIGQYLQPSRKHYPVHEYVTPEQFARYKETGEKKGFATVESGPLVRSSYHAEKHIRYK